MCVCVEGGGRGADNCMVPKTQKSTLAIPTNHASSWNTYLIA